MPTDTTTVHDLNAGDLLVAYISDRLDRMVDRLITIGGRGVAIAGRAEHVEWLHANVWAMKQLPIVGVVAPDAIDAGTASIAGAPVVAMDDPSWHGKADILLIADDRFQQALYDEALRHVPPKVQVSRLYDRLPVGREPLSAMGASTSMGVVTRSAAPRSADTAVTAGLIAR